jgi:rod shape-determining protein MreD
MIAAPERLDRPASPPGAILSFAAFAVLSWVAIAVEIAPTGGAAKPDLLVGVAAAWALRRPGVVPLAAVLAAGLLRDLLTDAPVGAGALGLTLAAAVLRANAAALAARGFLAQCVGAAVGGALAVLTPCALLVLTLAPQPAPEHIFLRIVGAAVVFAPLALALRPHGPTQRPVGSITGPRS